MGFTVIGDLHGNYKTYLKLTQKYEYTVQVGDFGFDYKILNDIDHTKHKIIGGNHDNYDFIQDLPHYLGDFGLRTLNNTEFYIVRGAKSIDQANRTIKINWWEEEELSHAQSVACIEDYKVTKPKLVISHCAPKFIAKRLIDGQVQNSNTHNLLGQLFTWHQPKNWIFGHYHKHIYIRHAPSNFYCIGINGVRTVR